MSTCSLPAERFSQPWDGWPNRCNLPSPCEVVRAGQALQAFLLAGAQVLVVADLVGKDSWLQQLGKACLPTAATVPQGPLDLKEPAKAAKQPDLAAAGPEIVELAPELQVGTSACSYIPNAVVTESRRGG